MQAHREPSLAVLPPFRLLRRGARLQGGRQLSLEARMTDWSGILGFYETEQEIWTARRRRGAGLRVASEGAEEGPGRPHPE